MEVVQDRLGDLGTPLAEVTFVVVDLETTGGSARDCGITEIGAVKVRGGEELGELQTFVNPGEPIPAFIQSLTGITDAMVRDAPSTGEAVASFLEFARGAVLVAHNAGFDIGFLKAACAAHGLRWPGPQVIDTVHLARQVVSRDEVRNHKLGTLAQYFGATTTPDHRALHDARATVDVLHGLIGRLGSVGVDTLEELGSYTNRVSDEVRRKRVLADGLPSAPGVYVFKDDRGEVLYVGTSVDIRARARSYFTASEQRRRMGEMVRVAAEITPIVCATTLEAQVRELRLIARHRPRYNTRSRRPDKVWWLKLTDEAFPPAVDRAHHRCRRPGLGWPLRHPRCGRGRRRRTARRGPPAAVPDPTVTDPPNVGLRARRHGPLRRPLHGRGRCRRVRDHRRGGSGRARR
ncbi:DEDD exonuclease domain-containing protein [Janibacter hoylei]|uniref:DEDD exonuclease domain-containing protein n=1 Tax=Janibacter hoylei TaxID=364298 RepID=UPI00068D1FA9